MASGTLYTFPENYRAFKVLIAAQYSGAKVQIPQDFKLGETNKSESFLKKFPVGKVPAFESTDGKCVFESNAIAHFVGNKQLRGQTDLEQSLIQQWIIYGDNEILPAMATWVYPCLGIIQYNKQTTERAKEDIKKVLNVLNNHLLTRTYLVGERISQADISVACCLLYLYQHVLDAKFRQSYGNVNRWFSTLVNQPQFKSVMGEVKLCETMAQFDAKKFAENQGKGAKQDKKDKPKQPKQEKKQQPKPKKKEEDDDAPLPDVPEEKKKKDPWEKIPVANFDFEAFKKIYSNNDADVSVPNFWEKVDKENCSIWFCEYKYADELKKTFMSANLINGMFQRLDKLRKHAFGSMVLSGVDNDSAISGIWCWRGQELAFTLSEDWQIDYDSYVWQKLDINSPETKAIVDQYFSWAEDKKYCGKDFNQGVIYK